MVASSVYRSRVYWYIPHSNCKYGELVGARYIKRRKTLIPETPHPKNPDPYILNPKSPTSRLSGLALNSVVYTCAKYGEICEGVQG